MTILRPGGCITEYKEIPTICPHCGYTETSTALSNDTKRAFVNATRYHRAITELRLLRKTKVLFDRFPDSRHRVVVDKMHLKDSPCEDAELDAELDADPDLRHFLRPEHGFYLPARLALIEGQLPEIASFETESPDLACPKCSQYRVLPESCYYQSGSSPGARS